MYFHLTITAIALMLTVMMAVQIAGSKVLAYVLRRNFLWAFQLIFCVTLLDYVNTEPGIDMGDWRLLHGGLACLEYAMAPFIAVFMLRGLNVGSINNILLPICFFNVLLEVFSLYSGSVFYVTEDNVLLRGKFYCLYMVIYIICLAAMFYGIYKKSELYQIKKGGHLLTYGVFISLGIAANAVYEEVYTAFLSVVITCGLLYQYFIEQEVHTDHMTGLLNKRAYDIYINDLQERTVIVIFDIDRFKYINDNYGHQMGDNVIVTIAHKILAVYAKHAYCFRIGGDEFAVLFARREFNHASIQAFCCYEEELKELLRQEEIPGLDFLPTISAGYAIHESNTSGYESARLADSNMYHNKRKRHESLQMRKGQSDAASLLHDKG